MPAVQEKSTLLYALRQLGYHKKTGRFSNRHSFRNWAPPRWLAEAASCVREPSNKIQIKQLQKCLSIVCHHWNTNIEFLTVGKNSQENFQFRVYHNNQLQKSKNYKKRTLEETVGEYRQNTYYILQKKYTYYLVKNWSELLETFQCPNCYSIFTRNAHLTEHMATCKRTSDQSEEPINLLHTPGKFKLPQIMQEKLINVGIDISLNEKLIYYFAAFDIETYCQSLKENKQQETTYDSTVHRATTVHPIACICLTSNLPSFKTQVFWNHNNDESACVKQFVAACLQLANCIFEEHKKIHAKLIEKLEQIRASILLFTDKKLVASTVKIIDEFYQYISTANIFGYNSSNFDTKLLVSASLLSELQKYDEKINNPIRIIRDNGAGSFLMIRSNHLRFVDAMKMLGSPCSLSVALFNFGVIETELIEIYKRGHIDDVSIIESSGGKLTFSYQTATNYESLKGNYKPFELDEFISPLTGRSTLSPYYDEFLEISKQLGTSNALKFLNLNKEPESNEDVLKMLNWLKEELKMDRMEFYQLYLKIDTISSLKLVEKLRNTYLDITHFDGFFNFLTLSSLAFQYLHRSYSSSNEPDSYFYNLDKETHDWIKSGIHGGLSHAVNRLHISNHTHIRWHQFKNEAKVAKTSILLDENSLYLSSIGIYCSTMLGEPIIRLKKNDYLPITCHKQTYSEYDACKYFEQVLFPGASIQTAQSLYGQKRLFIPELNQSILLDGYIQWPTKVGFSYSGCIFHGHSMYGNCPLTNHLASNPDLPHPIIKGKTYGEVGRESLRKDRLIARSSQLDQYYVLHECEFKKLNYKSEKHLADLRDMYLDQMTEIELLELIRHDQVHGIVQCDIALTLDVLPYFVDFTPLFKKESISLDLLDPATRNYALKHHLWTDSESRESLISAHHVTQAILSTDLLKFYLEFNLVDCNNITKFVQFRKKLLFRDWQQTLTSARSEAERKGLRAKSLALKAVGNHAYGKNLFDITRRPRVALVKYDDKKKMHQILNTMHHLSAVEAVGPKNDPQALVCISYFPKQMRSQSLLQFAFEILSASKMILFRWICEVLIDKFDLKNWQINSLDTDGINISLGETKIEDNCLADKKSEFIANMHNYLVPFDKNHPLYNELRIQPLLCKLEQGDGIFGIFLCPKTYSMVSRDSVHEGNKGICFKQRLNMIFTSAFNKLQCLFEEESNYKRQQNCLNVNFKYDRVSHKLFMINMSKYGLSKCNVKFYYICNCHCVTHDFIKYPKKLQLEILPYMNEKCPISFSGAVDALRKLLESDPNSADMTRFLINKTFDSENFTIFK
jgi:hypothetical protein